MCLNCLLHTYYLNMKIIVKKCDFWRNLHFGHQRTCTFSVVGHISQQVQQYPPSTSIVFQKTSFFLCLSWPRFGFFLYFMKTNYISVFSLKSHDSHIFLLHPFPLQFSCKSMQRVLRALSVHLSVSLAIPNNFLWWPNFSSTLGCPLRSDYEFHS